MAPNDDAEIFVNGERVGTGVEGMLLAFPKVLGRDESPREAFGSLLEALMEFCPRCGQRLVWRHSSAQCPACGFKEGCCGGVNPDGD
jgi:hypothetical protein